MLTSPDSVAYATGWVVPLEAGPSPFAGGPTLALVGESGRCILVAPNLETGPALADERVTFVGFSIEQENLVANYLAAVEEAIDRLGPTGDVAVEPSSLPHSVAEVLHSRGHRLREATMSLNVARMIKTSREVELLRESGRLAGEAQRTARVAAEAGMSELELFSLIRLTVESGAGARVAFAGDLVSGPVRTAAIGGWPTNRVIETGDFVIADLAPRVNGYWADSCNTFVVGEPTREQRRLHARVAAALECAVEAAHPGQQVSRVDQVVRERLARDGLAYPHHTGHSIGASVHEYPRIVPNETATLSAGMVILLEPGAYVPGLGGVRLERMYLVHEDRLESLTPFEQTL